MHSILDCKSDYVTVLGEASLVIQNSAAPASLLDTQTCSHSSAAKNSSLVEVGLCKQHGLAARVIWGS